MSRGVLRTEIAERDCASRAEELYRRELTLYRTHHAAAGALATAFEPVGLYTLKSGENGGSNPYAPAPWSVVPDGRGGVRKSCDCIGCALWCRGLDRYQPQRFAHLYGGFINTDSMLMDAISERAVTGRGNATAPQRMFRPASTLRPGVWIVYPSRFVLGRKVPGSWGHILTVVALESTLVENLTSELYGVSGSITVVHCHGGSRTPMAITRESLASAIGASAKRAHVIELRPDL